MSNKRKICVITGTRAEYGIMSLLMRSLQDDPRVELQIVSTNMHLSPEFGLTYKEIETDGFKIDKKIEMLLSSDTHTGTVKSMGLASIGFADAFEELKPDLIVILGDRYEMLAAASAALIFGIPVAHLYGGEITEGAYDDAIRHAITKLSYLHFTSTEEYRRRVIQMGESPERVHWVGSLGAENITKETLLSLHELEESISHELGEGFILATYHPVTKEPGHAEVQIKALLDALEGHLAERNVLFTLPNSDTDGRIIARMIENWASAHKEQVAVIASLGRKRYYSALACCAVVVGNSSSGLSEVPTFRKPTLNIGNRQKGRAQGNTIVNCAADRDSISEGLAKVLSPEFIKEVAMRGHNPYSKEGTLQEIHKVLVETEFPRNAVKQFYDIRFNI